MRVRVKNSSSSTTSVEYVRKDNLFDNNLRSVINENSTIYFIQEISGEEYELIFGDGIFGKLLEDGNVIEVSYIVSSGAKSFLLIKISSISSTHQTKTLVFPLNH